MEAKYTPGPWHADFHGHIIAHGGTTNVASTWTTPDDNYPEGRPYKANARLIAAAPELLEALKVIAECTDPEPAEENHRIDDREGCLDTIFSIARTAIEKVLGENAKVDA